MYEGILTPVSGKALGIKVDKESRAYEYIPEINERLKELNKKRIGDVLNVVSPKVTLFNDRDTKLKELDKEKVALQKKFKRCKNTK